MAITRKCRIPGEEVPSPYTENGQVPLKLTIPAKLMVQFKGQVINPTVPADLKLTVPENLLGQAMKLIVKGLAQE